MTVELEGRMKRMSRDAMIAQIDQLTSEQEACLAPKPTWSRAKMDPARFQKMCDGIVGFTLDVTAWRGTVKLGQNKPDIARIAAAEALEAQGRRAIAHLMRNPLA